MVTGRRAFYGTSQGSLIAAIMEHDSPRVSSSQPLAPRLLDHVIATCLAKDPDNRWQSIRDVRHELKVIAEATAASTITIPMRYRWSGSTLAWVTVLAFVIAAIALTGWLMTSRRATDARKITFELEMPSLGGATLLSPTLTISPDGRHLAGMEFEHWEVDFPGSSYS